MRRASLPVIAVVAVVAALLFATCDERKTATIGPTTQDVAEVPTTKAAPRKRTDAAVADPKPAEAPPSVVPTATSHEATTTFTPADAKVAAPTHVLRGRVVNPRGAPVGGVEVRSWCMWLPRELSYRRDEHGLPHAASRTITAVDGTFALRYWEGGPRGLAVFAEGRPRWFGQELGDEKFHEIVLADAPAVVHVRLTRAADGLPVRGNAVVRIEQTAFAGLPAQHDDSPFQRQAELTQSEPTVWSTAEAVAGPALLTVASFEPGDADVATAERRFDVPAEGDVTIDVALPEPSHGVDLRASVVDAATGHPVAGASFRVDDGGVVWSSDADGRVDLRGLHMTPRVFRQFVALAEGYAATSVFAAVSDAKQSSCDVVVRLQRGADLRCRCVDPNGRPVAGAFVVAFSDYDATPPGGMRTVADDLATADASADGRATLEGLHPGSAGLELRTRFYVDGVLVLERTFPPLAAGEARDLGDVVLAPTLTLRGVVLDVDGKPVAGATVGAAPSDPSDAARSAVGSAFNGSGGRRAETGPDGAFALMGLTAGLWDVYGAPNFWTPGRLELGVDPRVRTVTLRLPRVVALEGRIVDAKGAPVAGAVIEAKPDFFGMRTQMMERTLDDGRFNLPGFAADAPEFDVTVVATKGAEPQTFKVRPGVAGTELRLK